MKKLIQLIGSGFGAGYLPWMPGTWGSMVGVGVAYGFSFLPLYLSLISLIALIFLSVWVSDIFEMLSSKKDDQTIVIDEICGMALALLAIPFNLPNVLTAFLLFRFFDIAKIPPAPWFERRCPGGYGVVLDDLVAGAYTRGCMALLIYTGVL
ncbi:MAG: phosphatidylglycerophosphatase A [Deltaproteobacteria bacterium]